MDNIVLPNWAISDEEARTFFPQEGFLANYLEYMQNVTDAPVIYHLGAALPLLSMACPYCDVEEVSADGVNIQPIILWIGLVGYSGDRKSTSMEAAKRLLERFRSVTSEKAPVLFMDGSIEAWHDHLMKNPNTLIYRDELAQIFEMRGRGYLAGVTSWLLEMYSGDPKIRVVKRKDKAEGDDEEQKIIERPRVPILGGIPPEVLTERATQGDWASGFLARFKFFAGMRETWKMTQTRDVKTEGRLCKWLLTIPWPSRGMIKIPRAVSDVLAEWVWANVEIPRRKSEEHQALLSQLTRLQEFGARVAALYAMSRQTNPQTADGGKILVDKNDIDLVILLLNGLKRSSKALFAETQSTQDNREEAAIAAWVSQQKDGASPAQICQHFPGVSSHRVRKYLAGLVELDLLRRKQGLRTGKGRPPTIYYRP